VVDQLLAAGAALDQADDNGRTPLYAAAACEMMGREVVVGQLQMNRENVTQSVSIVVISNDRATLLAPLSLLCPSANRGQPPPY
jgi:hypothetical protein